MTYDEIVDLMNNDPVAQDLLKAPIPARLAYVATDGTPRVIPVSYLWNGKAFVFASPPRWTNITSLTANPNVAFTVDTTEFPPKVMLVRGVASIEYFDGIPDDYIEASRRIVGEDKMADWEVGVRATIKEMALVTISPTCGSKSTTSSPASPAQPSAHRHNLATSTTRMAASESRNSPKQNTPRLSISHSPERLMNVSGR